MSLLLTALRSEHERILAVIGAFQDFTRLHTSDDPGARAALREFIRFFREYLDGWHHEKEEDLLFETLVQAGLPHDTGPVACMRRDHELGRAHVRALASLADGDAPLSPTECALVAELAQGHARVLVPHIAKENQGLFPLAARLLPAELLGGIDEAAAALAARGVETGRDLELLADSLVARYGAAHVAAAP